MNTITLDARNVGSFLGPIASKYSYTPVLRARLDSLYESAKRSTNRFFVLDGDIVRAAQTTESGARAYMHADYVLVSVILGCGRMTHVAGTNGGTMPCGAKFNGEPYYCTDCE